MKWKRWGRGRVEGAFGEGACAGRYRSFGLGTCYVHGGAIIVEERAATLFEGQWWRWVKDAQACEVVRGMSVGQYLEQAEEIPADSSYGVMTAGKKKNLRSL